MRPDPLVWVEESSVVIERHVQIVDHDVAAKGGRWRVGPDERDFEFLRGVDCEIEADVRGGGIDLQFVDDQVESRRVSPVEHAMHYSSSPLPLLHVHGSESLVVIRRRVGEGFREERIALTSQRTSAVNDHRLERCRRGNESICRHRLAAGVVAFFQVLGEEGGGGGDDGRGHGGACFHGDAAGECLLSAGACGLDVDAGSEDVGLDATVRRGTHAGEGGADVAVGWGVVDGADAQRVLGDGGGEDLPLSTRADPPSARPLLSVVARCEDGETVGMLVARERRVSCKYMKLSMEAVSEV